MPQTRWGAAAEVIVTAANWGQHYPSNSTIYMVNGDGCRDTITHLSFLKCNHNANSV